MPIKLNRRGRANKETQALLNFINDWLKDQSEDVQYHYESQTYDSPEAIQRTWSEIQASPNYQSTSNISDADVQEEITENNMSEENIDTPNDNKDESTKTPFDDHNDNVEVNEPDGFDIPEEFNDYTFDPNLDAPKEREYSKANVDPSYNQPIEEPEYSAEEVKPIEEAEIVDEQPKSFVRPDHTSGPTDLGGPPPEDQPSVTNPELNEADAKTKKLAATQMVDMILNGYDKLHELAKPRAMIKPETVNKLIATGAIDPTDTIPINYEGDLATAPELVQSTNEGIAEILTPDPSFNAAVREPMIREFAKRGWGMTDMQYILTMFGQDIATKATMVIGVRRSMTQILDIYKAKQEERYAAEEPTAEAVEPDSISSSSPETDDAVYEQTDEMI